MKFLAGIIVGLLISFCLLCLKVFLDLAEDATPQKVKIRKTPLKSPIRKTRFTPSSRTPYNDKSKIKLKFPEDFISLN